MKSKCSVDGCLRESLAKGWCKPHYSRARANGGDPGPAEIMPKIRGRVCDFEGCVNRHDSNGLCTAHNYQRNKGQELHPLEARRSHSDRDEDGNRFCPDCREHFPEASFSRNGNTSDGLSVACRACQRARQLQRVYGMTRARYDSMMESQGGGCAVCGCVNPNGRELAVDHDHGCCPGKGSCGQCVRGLLCSNCNMAVGLMMDSPQRLVDAADYLRRYQ